VILYQMLCGEVPFKGSSIPSIMKKHLTLPPPSFQSLGVSVSPAIEAVVRHALEKEVAARTDSIETFLKELHAAIHSMPYVSSARETVALDPNRTIASTVTTLNPVPASMPSAGTTTKPPVSSDTQFAASFELMDGTISGTRLDEKQKAAELEDPESTHVQQRRAAAPTIVDEAPSVPAVQPPPQPIRAPVQPPAQPIERGKPMTIDLTPRRRGISALWFVGLGALVLVAIGLSIGGYFLLTRNTVPPGPGPTPTPTVAPPAKADLVAIAGGSFLMGRSSGPPQEQPAHPISVQPFQMDRTEVNNSEYADFVRDTNHAPPSHWAGSKAPFGQELWPVVNVSFDDAKAFAEWRSKRDHVTYRLPTEEEWEYAARNGEQGDLYPWGPNWKENAAVLKEAAPAAVGSRPDGRDKWGVADLIGNVWEWTSSKASVYPGNSAKVPDEVKDWIAIRGGCYVSDPGRSDKPVTACMRDFVPASTKITLLGFRLVRSGP
jgi:formylglycine-generating enzyme required for sulfatase activity